MPQFFAFVLVGRIALRGTLNLSSKAVEEN